MINIKPFRQTDDSRCAPACVKMILEYYGIEKSEEELCRELNHTYELGCTNEDTKKCLESYGLRVLDKEYGTIEDLHKAVYCQTPVIVDWFKEGVGHYSIVVDFDKEYITILDPETGQHEKMKHHDFMTFWFDWSQTEYISKENLFIRYMMVVIK